MGAYLVSFHSLLLLPVLLELEQPALVGGHHQDPVRVEVHLEGLGRDDEFVAAHDHAEAGVGLVLNLQLVLEKSLEW